MKGVHSKDKLKLKKKNQLLNFTFLKNRRLRLFLIAMSVLALGIYTPLFYVVSLAIIKRFIGIKLQFAYCVMLGPAPVGGGGPGDERALAAAAALAGAVHQWRLPAGRAPLHPSGKLLLCCHYAVTKLSCAPLHPSVPASLHLGSPPGPGRHDRSRTGNVLSLLCHRLLRVSIKYHLTPYRSLSIT